MRAGPLLACALLAGCGKVNLNVGDLWPFGGSTELSREPANATAYQCEGGRRFHVRLLDGGQAAWLILPERELRLEKEAAGGGYAYRGTRLELREKQASVFEGGAPVYADCKAPG